MKSRIISTLLLALSITAVNAQVVVNDGDVFLGIRNKGGSSTMVVDLGSMDQFVNDQINGQSQSGFVNSSSLLTALDFYFGGSWATARLNSSTVIGLFGGFQAGSSSSSIATMPDNALNIGNSINTLLGNQSDQTASTLTGYAAAIGANSGFSTAVTSLSTSAWYSMNGSAGGWDTYQYGGTPTAYNNQGSAAYGVWGYSLETQAANPLYVNFSYDRAFNNGYAALNSGTFTVSALGVTSYNVVPEPTTFALLGLTGVGLMSFFIRRKISGV